eukprot:tig00000383_g24619.t2
MWPVFSQLHVYALAWPCFRAAPRSRPAFLPQTDDGSPAVSPVGPVGWPCAQAEPRCGYRLDGLLGGDRALPSASPSPGALDRARRLQAPNSGPLFHSLVRLRPRRG